MAKQMIASTMLVQSLGGKKMRLVVICGSSVGFAYQMFVGGEMGTSVQKKSTKERGFWVLSWFVRFANQWILFLRVCVAMFVWALVGNSVIEGSIGGLWYGVIYIPIVIFGIASLKWEQSLFAALFGVVFLFMWVAVLAVDVARTVDVERSVHNRLGAEMCMGGGQRAVDWGMLALMSAWPTLSSTSTTLQCSANGSAVLLPHVVTKTDQFGGGGVDKMVSWVYATVMLGACVVEVCSCSVQIWRTINGGVEGGTVEDKVIFIRLFERVTGIILASAVLGLMFASTPYGVKWILLSLVCGSWSCAMCVVAVVGKGGVYTLQTESKLNSADVSRLSLATPVAPVGANVVGGLAWNREKNLFLGISVACTVSNQMSPPTMELVAMAMSSLPVPPMPIIVGQEVPDEITCVSGETHFANSHDLLAMLLATAMQREEKQELAMHKVEQEKATDELFARMKEIESQSKGNEKQASRKAEDVFDAFSCFMRRTIQALSSSRDVRFAQVSDVKREDRLHIAACHHAAAQDIIFGCLKTDIEGVKHTAEDFSGHEYEALLMRQYYRIVEAQ
eukprot:3933519-Rhodomonas_salina.3